MFEWLILHTLVTLALAGLAALGRVLRLGPATRHALWLLVLAKLMTPPLVRWPWPLPAWGPPADAGAGRAAPPAPEAPTGVLAVRVGAGTGAPAAAARGDRPLSPMRRSRAGEGPEAGPDAWPGAGVAADDLRAWLAGVVGAVWLLGGVAALLREGSRIARVRRLLGQARPVPGWLQPRVRALASALGVRPPPVRVLTGLGSPLVWGFGRACLLWPEGLEGRLTSEGCDAVLVHELAHLRRRDHWVGWVLLAGGCLWWWHPLFRLVRRQLGREAELACDAWVVGTLPGARRAYAEALLEVCQQWSWVAATPALGAAGRRRDLERRLVMVMRERVPHRPSRLVLMAAGLVALAALPAWTPGQQATPAPKTGAAAPTTSSPANTAAAQPAPEAKAPAPATADRDKKLQDLEAKLKAILKEVHEMRAAGRKPAAEPAPMQAKTEFLNTFYVGQIEQEYIAANKALNAAKAARWAAPAAVPAEVELRRKTYRLPKATAEALASFLREHVKAAVLEIKVDGENLVITTTPGVQRAIAEFIDLILHPGAERPVYGLPAAR